MIALLDGDIIVYRVGFTTMDAPPYIPPSRTDETIRVICQALDTNEYQVYLTGQGHDNFRYGLTDTYKANRKDMKKPTHYALIRDYLVEEHGAIVSEGEEADDLLGIEQTQRGHGSIICSIDKDLDQIPGWHYNFVKGLRYEINESEAIRFFWKQLLMGDVSDNIQGIRGIGPVGATKLLANASNNDELYQIVAKEYMRTYGDEWLEKLTLAGKLLWIRKEKGQVWEPPDIEVA